MRPPAPIRAAKGIVAAALLAAGGTLASASPPVPAPGAPAAPAPAAARAAPAAPATAPGAAPGPPLTRRQARKILRPPRGSLSLGYTNHGSLVRGVELRVDGPTWRVLPGWRERHTNWGTRELVGLLKRASRAVARRFPGSKLGVGNMSARRGGAVPGGSVSHKAGRDVDVAMYALRPAKRRPTRPKDRRRRQVDPDSFIPFDHDGLAPGGRLRFDWARNLAFVVALVTDTRAPVQYVFVADWLKRGLLERARAQGLPAETLERLDAVLHQPSDSNPHQQHFHIRIYCSVQDRLHGCLERGPLRPWVDLGDAAFAARVSDLERVARAQGRRWVRFRRRAVTQLGLLRARAAVPTLVAALDDPVAAVRREALRSLGLIASPQAVPALVGALERARDGEWAARLAAAVRGTGGPPVLAWARAILADPAGHLNVGLSRRARARVLVAAAGALEDAGQTKEDVEALVARLDDDARVGRAVHAALRRVTNQRIGRRAERGGRGRRWRRVARAWRGFLAQHGDEPWIVWARRGLEARGHHFQSPGPGLDRRDARELVRAIGHRERVASDNACRALAAVTGHDDDPRWRSRRNNGRHWRSWLAAHPAGGSAPGGATPASRRDALTP